MNLDDPINFPRVSGHLRRTIIVSHFLDNEYSTVPVHAEFQSPFERRNIQRRHCVRIVCTIAVGHVRPVCIGDRNVAALQSVLEIAWNSVDVTAARNRTAAPFHFSFRFHGVRAKTAIRKQPVHRRYRTNRPSSLTDRVRAPVDEPLRLFLYRIHGFRCERDLRVAIVEHVMQECLPGRCGLLVEWLSAGCPYRLK